MDESNTNSENLNKPKETKSFAETSFKNKTIKKINRLAAIFIILALLIALCVSWYFDTGKVGFIVFSYLFAGLLILPLMLGITNLALILYYSKQLKNGLRATAIILICAYLSIAFPFSGRRTKEDINGVRCQANLHQLGKLIIEYAKENNGYLPIANQWCDLLTEYRKSISRDTFVCPATKSNACSYSFNKNLDGLRLTDIPDDIVLLYEADGRWNCAGGVKLLTTKNHPSQSCNVLFADGTVRYYHAEELINQPLRWKP